MTVFRNPEIIQVSPMRELLRGNGPLPMPSGRDGFVVEDLDLVLRWYGSHHPDLDRWGRLRLVELKYGTANIGVAQRMTMGMIDNMARKSYPDRYDGFFVVQVRSPTEAESTHGHDVYTYGTEFHVNGTALGLDDFCKWCRNPWSDIDPMKMETMLP